MREPAFSRRTVSFPQFRYGLNSSTWAALFPKAQPISFRSPANTIFITTAETNQRLQN